MGTGKQPKRILHIVSQMGRGGAETLIMNIYRNIDKTKIQFDFVTHNEEPGDYDKEIEALGGKITTIPSLGMSGPYNYLKSLIKVMSSNDYAAVHAHTDYQSGFPALAAKMCGIHNRICHSHSNDWSKEAGFKEVMTLKALQTLIKLSATKVCSCSEEAAAFLFGKKKAQILNNGINLLEYRQIQPTSRAGILQQLNLPAGVKIIGHVGRFSKSKNQIYLLEVLQKLLLDDDSYYLILVGDGPLKKTVESEAEKMGLHQHVKFLGVRQDVPRLMNAFDVFLFPSVFEGFGIVMLEAQAAGTPCISSTHVTPGTDMGLGIVEYLPLDHPDQWCQAVKAAVQLERPEKDNIYDSITKRGFNINENVGEWLKLYEISN